MKLGSRVRLYESIRTAHLERAHQLASATILYRVRRYDFDDALAEGLHLVQAGRVKAAWLLARSDVRTLEVNEPLMVSSLPATVLALFGLRLRQLAGGRRPSVVSYAIGNADPFALPPARRLRSRVRRRLDLLLASFVARRVDRLAFGTSGARDVYTQRLPELRATQTIVPALPAPRPTAGEHQDGRTVVFLGALSQRKGFQLLLDAWPQLRSEHAQAKLLILGKGPLEQEARRLAEADDRVEFLSDPPRPAIFERLDSAQVLVLPSQASHTWREQVGLPIVEGLSSGCSIVTTSETGLAEWLRGHGHTVLDPNCGPDLLAESLAEQLRAARPASSVTAELPQVDGRLAADAWLFGDAAEPEETS